MHRPDTIGEALEIRRRFQAVPFAGGTDIMVKRRRGADVKPDFPAPVLFLDQCGELKAIQITKKQVEIGAGVTFSELMQVDLHPAFREAIEGIGAPAIRNVATIGGNICNASPAADALPFLYAVDARVNLETTDSKRVLPIYEFITGPGTTGLERDELVVSIQYKAWEPDLYYYRKVGTRKANALTKVSFLGCADVEEGRVSRVAIAFGAVAPTVIRPKSVERAILGSTYNQLHSASKNLLRLCAASLAPIDDQRSTRSYRSIVSVNLLSRFIQGLLAELSIWAESY